MKRFVILSCIAGTLISAACRTTPRVFPDERLVARGRNLFFNETFDGNGRTCATCHRVENNFTIDPAFIATLPGNDPLFVAEIDAHLGLNFENPRLMRKVGLVLENLDGFDDLENRFTMRGVPHTLGLRHTVNSAQGPRTGWSGDGAPGDGSLRSFAVGAVIQHFTRSLDRVPGVDFQLPTNDELNALEAFQLSLGRQEELNLPLSFKDAVVNRGQAIFNSRTEGKCFACHFNAGANIAPDIFGTNIGNLNFNTGVEELPDQPGDLTGEPIPPDDGFGRPGNGQFNTPSLVGAADTGPFFHNNSVATIEGAVDFYNGDAFNNSPAGKLLAQATGDGINLDSTQVEAVARFLRAINALENIRQSAELLKLIANDKYLGGRTPEQILEQAIHETDDAIQVLTGVGLHPEGVARLEMARDLTDEAGRAKRHGKRMELAGKAILEHASAQAYIVQEP